MIRPVAFALAALATVAPSALAQSWTARPLPDQLLPVHTTPGGKIVMHLDGLTPAGRPLALMVTGQDESGGARWLRVRLATRPNDASGWVRAEQVELRPVAWRVVVDLSERTLRLYRDGRVSLRTGVVIGKAGTPTPRGLFALWQTVPGLAGSTAPYELHLTAHSEVLTSFLGGPGRVAIHGMRAGLVAPLGAAVSNGCIRIPDAPLRRLARQLPPGTPILIRR